MHSTNCVVEFSAVCRTRMGETAVVSGSLPELGNWAPQKGLQLFTDSQIYPLWRAHALLYFPPGTHAELKLCYLRQGAPVRWQSLSSNRILSVDCNCRVQVRQGIFPLYTSEMNQSPLHHGTCEVLESLQSDSQEEEPGVSMFHRTIIEAKYEQQTHRHASGGCEGEHQTGGSRRHVISV